MSLEKCKEKFQIMNKVYKMSYGNSLRQANIFHQYYNHPIEEFITLIPSPSEEKTNHITIMIYSHGCDKPYPLFEKYDELKELIIPKVKILSSVPHSCFNYGYSDVYLSTVNLVYRNQVASSIEQLKKFKTEMIPSVQTAQRDELKSDNITEDIESKKRFSQLTPDDLYYIHNPSVDREYSFIMEKSDIYEGKQFGIYIVSSTLADDDVEYTYERNPVQFSQHNNILSDEVSPSLKKYTDMIKLIMQIPPEEPILKLSLQDLLYCIFSTKRWDSVHIIDLGCRQTCKGEKMALKRIPSQRIIDIEAERFGKKKQNRKTNTNKKKNKKIKNKRKKTRSHKKSNKNI